MKACTTPGVDRHPEERIESAVASRDARYIGPLRYIGPRAGRRRAPALYVADGELLLHRLEGSVFRCVEPLRGLRLRRRARLRELAVHSTSSSSAGTELLSSVAQPRTGSHEPPARSTSRRASRRAARRAWSAAFVTAFLLPRPPLFVALPAGTSAARAAPAAPRAVAVGSPPAGLIDRSDMRRSSAWNMTYPR